MAACSRLLCTFAWQASRLAANHPTIILSGWASRLNLPPLLLHCHSHLFSSLPLLQHYIPSEQLLPLLSHTLMPQSYAADTLNTILTLHLPGGARFPCSSPSYIPCPPLVKWRGHYTAGRAPFCRTASLGVSLSIARAGRSVVLQCVQACLCPWATAANKFTAAHCQWDTYSGFFFSFFKPWQRKIYKNLNYSNWCQKWRLFIQPHITAWVSRLKQSFGGKKSSELERERDRRQRKKGACLFKNKPRRSEGWWYEMIVPSSSKI